MKRASINYSFNEMKAAQISGRLLEKSGGKMNHMKLLKLLYLADREALRRWERPLTGDSPCSLPYGPVLSRIYDLIKHHPILPSHPSWSDFISETEDYAVALKKPAGDDELSQAEIDLVDRIHQQYGSMGEFELVEYCHKHCPEWKDPGDSSQSIPFEEIFRAIGKNEDEISRIAAEAKAYQEEDAVFSTVCL
ncbi:MAG: Panacea domain-containing protein [Candidatus Sumerlaeota bacterium]|nr:Panacea domain-containing protein [Candidatus Sumerlaeota bacterium]